MATLNEILQRKWQGYYTGLEEDNYASVQWVDPPPGPIPSENECRAWSDYVDWMIECDNLWESKQDEIMGGPGGILKRLIVASQTLVALRDAVLDVVNPDLFPANLKAGLDAQIAANFPTLPEEPAEPTEW